jgi:simple sugar transport system ATP-binding protein
MNENILEIKNIKKTFTGVTALDDISLCVKKGEVHGLMGENGAGKSTLIKILTGLYKADAGKIVFNGEERFFNTALSAQQAGISTIYQELNMIPYLSVSENIFLGRYPRNKFGIDWKTMHRKAQELVDELHIDIDVTKPLNSYGTAKQQIISIIRAVSLKSKLIVMDEPTSSLDANEVKILFGIMDKLKEDGIAMIFVSHRLDEVYCKCDRLSILKDGHYVGTYLTKEITQMELLNKMIGNKELTAQRARVPRKLQNQECVLEVRNVVRTPYVNNVSFKIYKGEVLGLSGLLGSGRTETARIIFGCDTPDAAEILIEGKKVRIESPEEAVRYGLAFCTENRREEGIFADESLEKNIGVCSLKYLSKFGFIYAAQQASLTESYINKLQIKTTGRAQLIKNLSGGNQQKVILARWMATKPKLIILDEPTRGIDVGAKAEIEKLIREFSDNGISVLFISSEMSELVRNCDRILVMRDGIIKGELMDEDIKEDKIMSVIAN